MSVGEILKALQDRSGMTTAELAEKANLPIDTINKIRSGTTRNPNADTIARLAGALGVSAGVLLGEDVPNPAGGPDSDMLSLYHAGLLRQKEAYELTISHMERNGRRWFYVAICLILLIVFVLTWDITHPYMGYIRY